MSPGSGEALRLPCHYGTGSHVYVWAGGQIVHRMTLREYGSQFIVGRPTETETLDIGMAKPSTFDEYAELCDRHEREHRPSEGWTLPNNMIPDRRPFWV